MFENPLIANRGDQQPSGGTAAQPNRAAAKSRKRYFTIEEAHV